MKTNLFKSLLLMVLACLSLVSCKKDEPENPLLFDAAYMQGLWNVYEDAAYGKKDLNVYFRFTSDGKSESYEKSNSDKYTYRTGSFVIENKWLRLTHKTSRHFHTIEGVDRYVADFKGSGRFCRVSCNRRTTNKAIRQFFYSPTFRPKALQKVLLNYSKIK